MLLLPKSKICAQIPGLDVQVGRNLRALVLGGLDVAKPYTKQVNKYE